MLRDFTADYAVLQNGFWRMEVDLAHPRIVSLRADALGLARYSQEMLEPGFGGESLLETSAGTLRSRDSRSHCVAQDGSAIAIRGIQLGDAARADWRIDLAGDQGRILQIEITRMIVKPVTAITEVVFGLQCLREFAFWSHPSLRFAHDPAADGCRVTYAPFAERERRRVIGYHAAAELPGFFVHGSPSYPDFAFVLDAGFHHAEQHYCRHVTMGASSRDFSGGLVTLQPGVERWTLQIRPVAQGETAPVSFRSGNAEADAFVPQFFDGHLLSGVACDHEYFGNNPYRHAACPGALHFMTRACLITDRRAWTGAAQQGDIEERWRLNIRRILREGRVRRDRIAILMDSGTWQDACGKHSHEYGSTALDTLFVLACCQAILKSGDRAFAEEIFDDLSDVLQATAARDLDGDGLLEATTPGTPGTPSSSYNDNLSEGHKDGYLNAHACEAFALFASLAEFLGRVEESARYRDAARGIARACNEQLWDERAGHYIGWKDVAGVSHDAWFTHVNFPIVAAGIAPEDRLQRLMQSFLAHPGHHRIFAAGVHLEPVADGCISEKLPFGLWLNGGVLLGPASFELYARAVGGGGECAWEMLRDIMAQWRNNRLSCTPMLDWCRPLPGELPNPRLRYTGGNAWTWIDGQGATGAGTEPYLSDGAAMVWAVYAGILGIRADFQEITLVPHLPRALAGTEVAIRLMGRRIVIRYHGHGDKLEGVCHNGRPRDGAHLPWAMVNDGDVVDIHVVR
jgi:hypothetical protein